MPAGGKRAGSGRKPGSGWKGRNPTQPALRAMAKSRVREVLTTANDPIAVLVEIANDPAVDVSTRVQAAIGAAPFMFPRLSAMVVAQAPASAKEDTAHLIDRLMQRFAKLASPGLIIEGVQIDPGQMMPAPGKARV